MTIDCTIASNIPEWLDEMKKTIEDIFGVKLVDKTKDNSTHHCKCGHNCHNQCHSSCSNFDNVEEIEHID